ncbi:unnamed protein product [marine sediment metagenome]|uniref:Uncharacterized protein n=1 Tax=marine sediment metagenome TaxID=412755 RepID=X1RU28_9ZZZZ
MLSKSEKKLKNLKRVLIKNLLSGLKMKEKDRLRINMGEFFIMSQNMYLKMEGLKDGQKMIIKMYLFKEGEKFGE